MKAQALQNILLVKAVEESDADGSVLPVAEREAATREALRAHPAPGPGADRPARERHAWRVLEARAAGLKARLEHRHPVVAHALRLEDHAGRLTLVLVLAAFVAGAALSLWDSRTRIEILAFPLAGVVLWNLAVYAWLAYVSLRRDAPAGVVAGAFRMVTWPARWAWRRAAGLIRKAAFHHKPLASALRQYSDQWWPLAQPLLVAHGKRLFHLAAAALAAGLVAGFYFRGMVFEFRAGWESTFLGPAQVSALLHLLYGPAAALTGVALPADAASVSALHWPGGAGGGAAAPWIHLMAATALLYVIVPRLLLAAAAWIELERVSRRVPVPDPLLAYARGLLAGSDAALPAARLRVVPYAYRPAQSSRDGMARLLRAAYGGDARVDLLEPVPYGAEEQLASRLAGDPADVDVLLLDMAATPEAENHGTVLTAARAHAGASATARLLVLVDESPFLEAMRGLPDRVTQRRDGWSDFVARHGLDPCSVALAASPDGGAGPPADLVDAVRRSALRGGG
jgi:hypothetical protein